MHAEWQTQLQKLCDIAEKAGKAIMTFYPGHAKGPLNVTKKPDQSPVTQADLAANQIITAGLKALYPEVPIISEESDPEQDWQQRRQWSRCWLVDPLDGTRGFIEGIAEFSVNIALIEQGLATAAVIYNPISQTVYFAAKGQGAYKKTGQEPAVRLCTRTKPEVPTIAVGRYHNPKRIAAIMGKRPYSLLSLNSSLKFCALAEGEADIYPRLGPTSEWDTAAGQCLLEAAGGVVVDLSGRSLQYNARDTLINGAFLALGRRQDDSLISVMRELAKK